MHKLWDQAYLFFNWLKLKYIFDGADLVLLVCFLGWGVYSLVSAYVRKPEDLRDEFYHLRSKYGRYSAVIWYTVQSGTIFVKAAALHCGFSYGKSLTQFLNIQSS